jgi:phage repressor protein C with HTH and peptisase S24 domain
MIDGAKLKAAREAAGLSQAALAKRIGAAQQLIGQLERGEVKSTKLIFKIAEALTVAPNFLDRALPATSLAQRMIPVVGYVGAGAEVFAIDDHAKGGGMDEVDCPWADLAPSTVAVRVRGDSMAPAYFDGDLIFYERSCADFLHLLGKECVIALTDGRRFVKQLRRTASGAWYLHSHNAEPILGVEIEWAGKVKLIQRAE